MSKKPASLTSDLLARKGEAEPSTIDPTARMTLSAGPGHSDYGGGRQRDDTDDEDARPVPPEPEIIYTAEDSGGGGGTTRLIIIAVLGIIIVGGIFLAMSGTQPETVAPLATNIPTQTPQAETAPETLNTVPPVAETPAPAANDASRANNMAQAETPAAPAPETPALTEAPTVNVAEAPVKAAQPVAEPKAAAPEKPAPAATPQSSGAYVVQLLAVRDEAAAKSAWAKIEKKHSTILAAHALDIEKADLGSKGVWYRVRAAGFKSKAAASNACGKLKSAGQDCLVKRR